MAASPSPSPTAETPSAAGGAGGPDLTLSPHNRGGSGRSKTCCGLTLRALVSKKKLRFVAEGHDLDLSYITDRILAMGYPSVGLEAVYRNPAHHVHAFLEGRHAFHYRIWNLCSEREYGRGSFNCEVERFAWADHTPPPLAMVRGKWDVAVGLGKHG
jgi:phosphatidylinositol-3,4,5-trisphosphate 3-phosphatase/dual-specificity protein phosphatase PTEN